MEGLLLNPLDSDALQAVKLLRSTHVFNCCFCETTVYIILLFLKPFNVDTMRLFRCQNSTQLRLQLFDLVTLGPSGFLQRLEQCIEGICDLRALLVEVLGEGWHVVEEK